MRKEILNSFLALAMATTVGCAKDTGSDQLDASSYPEPVVEPMRVPDTMLPTETAISLTDIPTRIPSLTPSITATATETAIPSVTPILTEIPPTLIPTIALVENVSEDGIKEIRLGESIEIKTRELDSCPINLSKEFWEKNRAYITESDPVKVITEGDYFVFKLVTSRIPDSNEPGNIYYGVVLYVLDDSGSFYDAFFVDYYQDVNGDGMDGNNIVLETGEDEDGLWINFDPKNLTDDKLLCAPCLEEENPGFGEGFNL